MRKFINHKNKTKSISGSFFIGIGGFNGGERTEEKVRLSWKCSDGTYVISECEYSQIRIRINDSIKNPFIEIHHERCTDVSSSYLGNIDYNEYIIVNCSSDQYESEIELNKIK